MAGPVKIAILANGAQAKRELSDVQRRLGGLGKFGKTAAIGGLTALAYGAARFGIAAVNAEREYSTSMRLIQASTGATDAQIKELNDTAMRLGAETSFSAAEAADAMLELGKAGQNTNQILKTVPEVMNLAATEGMELDRAAGLVTASLAQFGLKAGDAERVVNALAGASNASRSSVEGLGESMKLVGNAGAGIGLSVEETAAALAALSQAGLDGSVAGTSLAAVFNRLVPQTSEAKDAMRALNLDFTDARGNFDDIDTIAGKLADTFGDMDAESRKVALGKIFGRDASTLAAVNALIGTGAKGLRDFTKAAEDNNAAQKLATARMSGTEGAIEKLNGAVETARLRLGQELAPAVIAGADLLDDKLVPAMDAGIDAAKELGDALAPAAEEIAEAIGHLVGEGDALGDIFDNVLIPAIRGGAEVIGFLVDLVDDLPGPIKDIILQAGIAAAVFPRLAGGVSSATGAISLQIAKLQQLRAEMTYTETRAAAVSGAMGRVKAAAGAAAGVGGMVLLTQGLSNIDQEASGAERAMGAFATVAGATLTGLSLGGPVGGAVGAVVGTLIGVKNGFTNGATAAREAKAAMEEAAHLDDVLAFYRELKASLDEVTGAYTGTTRAAVSASLFDDTGKAEAWVTTLNQAGISTRTLVSGILGQKGATEQLNGVLAENDSRLAQINRMQDLGVGGLLALKNAQGEYRFESRYAAEEFLGALGKEEKALEDVNRGIRDHVQERKRAVQTTREQADASTSLAQRLGITRKEAERIPKDVRMILRHNLPDGMRQLKNLNRQVGGLDKRTIRLLLKNLGFEPTEKRIKAVQESLKNVTRTRGEAKLDADDRPARRKLEGLDQMLRGLETKPRRAKLDADDRAARNKASLLDRMLGDLGPYNPAVDVPVPYDDFGRINAAGNALGPWYATVFVTYRPTNSPPGGGGGDKEAQASAGLAMAAQVAAGFGGSTEWARAGKDALDKILKGFLAGREDAGALLGRFTDYLTKQIEKNVKLKDDRKETQRERELRKQILRSLRDEYAALKKNERQQRQNNRELEKAKQHLQEVRGWVDSVRAAFVQTAAVIGTGLIENENGVVVGAQLMLDQLENRRNDALRFAQIIRDLTDDVGVKLNSTTLQELLTAGPQAGLATAEALEQMSAEQLAQLNAWTKEIEQAGQQLGVQMSDQVFDVGLRQAEAMVRGLEQKQKRLDRIAERMAERLADELRKLLGGGRGDGGRNGNGVGSTRAFEARLRDGSAATAATLRLEPIRVGVRLTAAQLSGLQRGRETVIEIDAAEQVGTRRLAVTVGGAS